MTDFTFDHLAFRVADREKAREFLEILGYSVETTFKLRLNDGSEAESYAMKSLWDAPDVFVSSGPPGSLIDRWVAARGGVGSIHHLAYSVSDVFGVWEEWKSNGTRFTTDEPLVCSCPVPLVQVFTEPHPDTGVILELICRNGHPGFCEDNVRRLMESSSK